MQTPGRDVGRQVALLLRLPKAQRISSSVAIAPTKTMVLVTAVTKKPASILSIGAPGPTRIMPHYGACRMHKLLRCVREV